MGLAQWLCPEEGCHQVVTFPRVRWRSGLYPPPADRQGWSSLWFACTKEHVFAPSYQHADALRGGFWVFNHDRILNQFHLAQNTAGIRDTLGSGNNYSTPQFINSQNWQLTAITGTTALPVPYRQSLSKLVFVELFSNWSWMLELPPLHLPHHRSPPLHLSNHFYFLCLWAGGWAVY